MTDLAFPKPLPLPELFEPFSAAWAKSPGRVRPRTALPPTWRRLRRVRPSQVSWDAAPGTTSIVRSGGVMAGEPAQAGSREAFIIYIGDRGGATVFAPPSRFGKGVGGLGEARNPSPHPSP